MSASDAAPHGEMMSVSITGSGSGKSDTPHTDAIVNEFPDDADHEQQTSLEAALISHARQLERDLTTERARFQRADDRWMALGAQYEHELAALQDEVNHLKISNGTLARELSSGYICECGVRVNPHRCRGETDF